MKKLSALTLVFSVLSNVFFLALILLRIPFPVYRLMSWQDTIDIVTPVVLIPLYWALYKQVTCNRSSLASEVAFMVMAGFWGAGQGMHLSANSIDNLLGNLAKSQIQDVTATDVFSLTYFYDEHLSHYLWHIGVIGFAVLLIYEAWRQPVNEHTSWKMVIPAGVLYGFLLFCIFLEGNTMPIGLPFVIAVVLLVLLAGRGRLAMQPVLAFLFMSCLVAVLLFGGWRLFWGCFPPILEPYHC
jgi:hypothetical protein